MKKNFKTIENLIKLYFIPKISKGLDESCIFIEEGRITINLRLPHPVEDRPLYNFFYFIDYDPSKNCVSYFSEYNPSQNGVSYPSEYDPKRVATFEEFENMLGENSWWGMTRCRCCGDYYFIEEILFCDYDYGIFGGGYVHCDDCDVDNCDGPCDCIHMMCHLCMLDLHFPQNVVI